MRKCSNEDIDILYTYLKREPEINLFFIGDIYNEGLDSEKCVVYADEDEDGIHALYLVYRQKYMVVQSYENKRDETFVKELCERYPIETISGETGLLDGYELPSFTRCKRCYFAGLREKTGIEADEVIRLKEEDAEEIAAIVNRNFPEDKKVSEKEVIEDLKTGHIYGIRKDGKLVAHACSNAECPSAAMVMGVCTDEEERGQGLAQKVVGKLSDDLLDEGKIPCLFYFDPIAAGVYRKLGYRDVGLWSIRSL